MKTRLGEITFAVPQVRGGGFYPSALAKGSRTDQAVNLMMAEMYVQGVSTRKVIEVLQRLRGPELSISSSQVSRATEQLDTGLARAARLDLRRVCCWTPAMSGYVRPSVCSSRQSRRGARMRRNWRPGPKKIWQTASLCSTSRKAIGSDYEPPTASNASIARSSDARAWLRSSQHRLLPPPGVRAPRRIRRGMARRQNLSA